MTNKWEAFDGAVALLAAYIRRGVDGWDIAIYVDESGDSNDITPAMAATLQAHRVLDLLAEMGLQTDAHWRPKRSSKIAVSLIFGADTFPEAVLAAVTSDEFISWRQGVE